jgi:hypothetical protein
MLDQEKTEVDADPRDEFELEVAETQPGEDLWKVWGKVWVNYRPTFGN